MSDHVPVIPVPLSVPPVRPHAGRARPLDCRSIRARLRGSIRAIPRLGRRIRGSTGRSPRVGRAGPHTSGTDSRCRRPTPPDAARWGQASFHPLQPLQVGGGEPQFSVLSGDAGVVPTA